MSDPCGNVDCDYEHTGVCALHAGEVERRKETAVELKEIKEKLEKIFTTLNRMFLPMAILMMIMGASFAFTQYLKADTDRDILLLYKVTDDLDARINAINNRSIEILRKLESIKKAVE